MKNPRRAVFFLVLVFALSLIPGVVYGQQVSRGKLKLKNHARFRTARAAMKKHTRSIMQIRGVVATAIGIGPDGEPVGRVFTSKSGIAGIPETVDGFRVNVKVSGRFYALASPEDRWDRPVPIGVSTGHPNITAGTIGARVTDGTNVFALSNNHVYADINNASIGDNVLQPGSFDGGVNPADAIGTLADFEPIHFCTVFFIWLICSKANTIDAAIATTSASLVGTSALPPPDGYGTPPNAVLHTAYGDPIVIGDENISLLLGESVHKSGRTTGLTSGTVDAINATVDVCYDQACSLIARFVDQIIIIPGTFSAGGDSGSLVVTQDGNNPVGLLFAGSNTNTIANRIDLVLNRFGVSIDTGTGATASSLSIDDVSVMEGDAGTTEAVFTVSLSPSSTDTVTVDFATADGSATEADSDYIGTSGTLNFQPGETTWTISVAVSGDTNEEPDENFYVDLSNPVNATIADNQGEGTILNDEAPQSASGPTLRTWQGWVSTDAWTTVTLDQDYGNDMVVACTPNYDRFDTGPAVVRVRNAVNTSFEVGLARPWFGALPGDHWSAYVHCMVVGAGVYTDAEHGVKMEAVRLENFTSTDNSGSWVGEPQNYANNYNTPVVVGQVISPDTGTPPSNCPPPNYICDSDWSVFWSRGTGRNQPPSSSALYVGRHTGQDPNARPPETIAYVVIEAGSGSIQSIDYEAGLGSDTVRGPDNRPPYSYTLSGGISPSTAILSQAGMDGGDGGWAMLYGSAPVTASRINIAIDEDWYWDSERKHTTEQVGYIVFE